MGKKAIASVDCVIPGDLSEFIPFESKVSLLDFDIILFNPCITEYTFSRDQYLGKPSLPDDRSFRLMEASEHWRRELTEAYNAGKTIIVFLPELQEVYVDTGKRKYSGTGRNRQTTQIVNEFNNYMSLPLSVSVTASEGNNMRLTKEGGVLANYWKEFESSSSFKVIVDQKDGTPSIVTKSGGKAVGTILRNKSGNGAVLTLPYLELWSSDFDEEIEVEDSSSEENETQTEIVWTDKGVQFGNKLLKAIVEIDRAIKSSSEITPTPDWVESPDYTLPKEAGILESLLQIETKLEELEKTKEGLKNDLLNEGQPRRLLFEKGKPLENSIIVALEKMGFSAAPFEDSKSEFDVVFESTEGRLLGEAEGKDNKQINVDKLRQLEMNIHEDFERDEVQDLAKGVLFGNAYRTTPIGERGEYFTEKCMTAAKRNGTALVRTPDLFKVVQYLSEHDDQDYAKKCRLAIINANGEVVVFPDLPKTKDICNDKVEEVAT